MSSQLFIGRKAASKKIFFFIMEESDIIAFK